MNITILDDYQDTIRTLPCFGKVAGHHITIWNDHTKDTDTLAERLRDTEALALAFGLLCAGLVPLLRSSGGELARVALALKTALSRVDRRVTPTA